jgi:hypothetical protein
MTVILFRLVSGALALLWFVGFAGIPVSGIVGGQRMARVSIRSPRADGE